MGCSISDIYVSVEPEHLADSTHVYLISNHHLVKDMRKASMHKAQASQLTRVKTLLIKHSPIAATTQPMFSKAFASLG